MKNRSLILVGFVLLFAVSGAAMCPVAVTPPNSFVHLTDESQGLVAWDEERQVETYVVRQGYEGVASDFGLILPTPAEPEIKEAEDGLFRQLHDLTKEPTETRGGFGARTQSMGETAQDQVEVVRQEQIGDFDLAVLRANATEPMLDWLDDHNYTYGPRTEDNVRYYIDEGGFYFTAMKINVEEASCLTKQEFELARSDRFRDLLPEDGTAEADRCWLRGGLSPMSFTFDADEPMLPLRIMAKPHDESPMTQDGHDDHDHTHDQDTSPLPPGDFLLYTVSDQPLTVPGAKVKYANRMGSVDDPLANYNVSDQFLVRQRITFNAHEVQHDLVFQETEPFYQARDGAAVINPDDVDTANGMMAYDDGRSREVEFVEDPGIMSEVSFQGGRVTATVSGVFQELWSVLVQFALIVVLGIPSLVIEEPLTMVPFLLLTVLFGLFWSRRRSVFIGAGGLAVGSAMGTFLLRVLEGVIGSVRDPAELSVVFMVASMIAGVIAFLVSTALGRFHVFEGIRRRMEAVSLSRGIGVIGAAVTAGVVVARWLHGDYDYLELIPLYSVVFTGIASSALYWLSDGSNVIEESRRDWLYVVALVVLLIMTVGLLVIS